MTATLREVLEEFARAVGEKNPMSSEALGPLVERHPEYMDPLGNLAVELTVVGVTTRQGIDAWGTPAATTAQLIERVIATFEARQAELARGVPSGRAPDAVGRSGKAWIVPRHGEGAPCVRAWVVLRPGAHPMWSWWCISVVHLREIEGFPSPNKERPEITHEFMIQAIDPRNPPDPDAAEVRLVCMTPIDVVAQFEAPSDADAIKLCDAAVTYVVNGASPDQDLRQTWIHWVARAALKLRGAS